MGCAGSVEQQHPPAARTSPAAYKQEHGGSRTKAEREDASLQRSSANKSNGLPHSSSKRGSKVKRNQVAPEPIAEPEHSAAADTKTAPDQQQHRASATGSLLGSVAAQSLVETGLTSWNSRQCALKQSWQPFIQELQDLGTKLQGDRAKLTEASAKMQQLLRRAPEWLDTALASPPADAACMLQACSNAACQLANCVLQPIVLHAERSLTHGEASSSGSLPRGPRWDSLDVDQLISALQAGCESEYGVDLATAAEPAKRAAELLVLMQQRCARQPHLHARVSSCVVLALDKVVSMLGIIFFKRVVLEDQAALGSKMQQLGSVCSALGWPDNRHLAVCLQPHARAMLAGLQHAADHGGELKASFQVRRAQAFWDALQQATEQGLLPADDGAAAAGGGKGQGVRAQVYKVFPSFVDEWASDGKVMLEAGEGHGPRKEFFALVAASMAGLSIASAHGHHAAHEHNCDHDQEHHQHQRPSSRQSPAAAAASPSLFTFNRSAGSFWYNSTLQQSKELQQAYCFAGWLMGQSISNKAPLGVPLAVPMLQQLLDGLDAFAPELATLEAFDPTAAGSIRNVAALPDDQVKALVEMEGLPEGTTREQYVQQAVRGLLLDSVHWQAQALAAGFRCAADVEVLQAWCIDAETLAMVLNEGGDSALSDKADFDIRKVFRVVMDDELAVDGAVLGGLFWEVVNAWPRERKLQLLLFVTGSSRLPLPGSELLKIEAPFVAFGLAEHKAQLGMLPQAHTCDNLLELPNYWDALLQVKGFRSASKAPADLLPQLKEECKRVMDERLTMAITNCTGYGLDQRERDGSDE